MELETRYHDIEVLIESHKEEFYRLKKTLKEWKKTVTIQFELQYRLKTGKSLYDKVYTRKINDISSKSRVFAPIFGNLEAELPLSSTKDIIGFRIIHPWTCNLHSLADELQQHPTLNIFEREVTERNRVIYLFGHTSLNTVYEIQLWTSLIYTAFEYDHDRIYKPMAPITEEMKQRAAYVREREHYLQDILDLDENVLVHYKQ